MVELTAVGDSAVDERRLLVAAQEARRKAVAPLDLAEEGLAVLRVADGARADREHALGLELLELAAVVGEHVAHARHRQRQEPAPLVDALAEPRDRELALDLVDVAVVDVRHEQAGGIRAQIHDSDAHLPERSGAILRRATRGGAVR